MALLHHDAGHEVWGLYRVQEVMRAVTSFDPDAMLLDIALPRARYVCLALDAAA